MSQFLEQPRFSCALSAQQTVLAIPRAHPIVHSGPGCSENASRFGGIYSGYQGEGYTGGAHISCTNSTQKEIIFGGEEKLRNLVGSALKVIDADLYVILTGCTADIIGDDTKGVASEFAEEGYPVVGAETAGFKGTVYYGYEQVIHEIVDQFVGEVEPDIRRGLVNVFSVVPYQNPFWQEDLRTIKHLLEGIGLEVNILFGVESDGISEWKDIPNAQFNLLISPWVGLSIVEYLKDKYGTPFLHFPNVPVGAKQSSSFLRTVGEYAGIDKEIIKKRIEKEEKIYYTYFNSLAEFIEDYREDLPIYYHTVADSNYGLGTSLFLTEEFGMTAKGLYITDQPQGIYREQIKELAKQIEDEYQDIVQFEIDGRKIQDEIKHKLSEERELILGSTWEKFLTKETQKDLYIELSLPLAQFATFDTSYAGYRGGIQLVKSICNHII